MRKTYLLLGLLAATSAFSQSDFLTQPVSHELNTSPDWSSIETRAAEDSCGAYFNNYIGLEKTTDLYFEGLRTGSVSDFDPYAGRGQRFHAYQPIEVSGVQFYAFHTNPDEDSLMVVTLLYDYDQDIDSAGAELARDTVWVKHDAFTADLPEIEVNSYFDSPVLVEEDYIVALYTSLDDSLKIITNDPSGDGEAEGVSFAYYDNPAAPSYTGWYNTLATFGPGYDIDYLINPRVKYKMSNDFILNSDSICPLVVSAACVEYNQFEIFSDPHYNRHADEPESKIRWYWGDGLQNEDLTELCHTYSESGTYTISMTDTIRRFEYAPSYCVVELSQTIEVLDSASANASFTHSGSTVYFDGEPFLADSVFWDFGDGNSSSLEDPTYTYSEIGTFEAWFYVFGPCNTDSILVTVTTDDVSIAAETKAQIKMYPNPTADNFNISGISSGTIIQIHTILGEKVYQSTAQSSTVNINVSQFAKGTYFVQLKNGTESITKKLIIH
ncbi:T9SS type A sorting domain-containing protein [Crocinitomix algicola]|uniref:T9SS type A sorting domain-containing protein n=1 Tax=Crocinitomix algicola TaxID=1740263 RepID=UPI000872EB64|nr:T9SS type A sorting domain-containing protein [Crocinitomix algicola]